MIWQNNDMHTSHNLSASKTATCPACGLLCDDIVISPSANTQQPFVIQQQCAKAIAFFSQTSALVQPQIAGKNTDLISATAEITRLLKQSNQPLYAGLGTDVQGMRAILALAEKTHGTLDHMHSDASVRNTLTLQNTGWQTTTLTEIKNRADLIIAIGTDITSSHPRFIERVVSNEHSLFKNATTAIEYLLTAGNIEDIAAVINALNALALNKPLRAVCIAGITTASLISLLDKIKAAKYCVIVWSASQLNFPHAELTVQSIVRLIATLNQTTRVAGFPLSSGDGDTSVNATSTWLTGFATRNRFTNGKVAYNNHQFCTQKQLATSDLVVWVSSFNPYTPPETHAPLVVIGHPNTKFNRTPEVFIPVGVPGLNHTGMMFRMDSAVTLPLKKLRDSHLPSLSEVCLQISKGLT